MKTKIFCNVMSISFLIFSFLLSGCKEQEKAGPIRAVLAMATSADNPPFEFHRIIDGKDEIVGFDIDLAQLIAQSLGMDLEIKDMDFNNVIPALQSHRFDFVMAAMTATDERRKNVSFSNIYYKAQSAVISLKGKELTQEQDFTDKKIGVQLGSTYEQLLKKMAKRTANITVVSLNKLGDLLQEVRTGRLDGLITEMSVAQKYIQLNPELSYRDLENQEAEYVIVFPKDSDKIQKFNEVLDKLKAQGKIEELAKKWFKF